MNSVQTDSTTIYRTYINIYTTAYTMHIHTVIYYTPLYYTPYTHAANVSPQGPKRSQTTATSI